MIIDILQEIINYSKLSDQLQCFMINKHVYENIYIYKLNVPKKMSQKIFAQINHKLMTLIYD